MNNNNNNNLSYEQAVDLYYAYMNANPNMNPDNDPEYLRLDAQKNRLFRLRGQAAEQEAEMRRDALAMRLRPDNPEELASEAELFEELFRVQDPLKKAELLDRILRLRNRRLGEQLNFGFPKKRSPKRRSPKRSPKKSPKRLLVGTKSQVWKGLAKKTSKGLTKKDLMKNKNGNVVMRK